MQEARIGSIKALTNNLAKEIYQLNIATIRRNGSFSKRNIKKIKQVVTSTEDTECLLINNFDDHSRVDWLALAVPVPEHCGDLLGGGGAGDVTWHRGRAAGGHPNLHGCL